MQADSITLRSMLTGSTRYVVPAFQRDYAWGGSNRQKLWDDILHYFKATGEGSHSIHFMGALTFRSLPPQPGSPPVLQIINGQQRLLTISILLCALRNTAHHFSLGRLADEIEKKYLRDEFEEGRDAFRISPRQRNRREYQAAVTGKRAPKGRIGKALRFFSKRLAEDVIAGASNAQGGGTSLEDTGGENLSVSEVEENASAEMKDGKRSASAEEENASSSEDSVEGRLRRLLNILSESLRFVHITLGDEVDPHQIYQLINEAGVDLTKADLVRSKVMRHVPAGQQEDFEADSWRPVEDRFATNGFEKAVTEIDEGALSSFYTHDVLTEGSYVFKSDTDAVFEKRYIEEAEGFTPEKLAADFRRKARIYSYLREGVSHPSELVAEAIQQLVALDTTTAYPAAFKLLNMLDSGETTVRVVETAVRRLAGFVMRRKVCGLASRGYVRWFAFICKYIEEHEGGPLAGLTAFLVREGYPGDERFMEKFAEYDLYHADCTRAVLEGLERSHSHREPANLSRAEVEHIMPQNLNKQWREDLGPDAEDVHRRLLHVPGNLTLTAYNNDISDDPFASKRQEYIRSNVQLTRHLGDLRRWGVEEIEARSHAMSKRAAQVWAGPPEEDGL